MSAEILRRAAALMRERADGATPGPWIAFTATKGGGSTHGVTTDLDVDYEADLFVGSSQSDAVHIAGMSPAVALAVADWLDAEFAHQFGPTAEAIDVARAYLGESA